jgi:Phage integrase family/Phage integrase, N-terminal SAM-like domain
MDGRVGVRGSTLSSYGSIVRKQLIPYFGKMSLSEIGYDQVQSFVHELAKEVSVKTLRNIIVCLRVMLVGKRGGSALKRGFLRHDPTREIAAKAGLPGVRFHDLRHFFASMLIAQGESAKYVCDQMGHSSIQVTFDTYGHLFPNSRETAAKKLQQAMFTGRKDGFGSSLVAKPGKRKKKTEPPGDKA